MVLPADDLLTVTSQSRHARVRMRAELAGLIAVAGRSGRMTAYGGRSRRWCSGRKMVPAMVALVVMTREGRAGHRRCGNPCCWGGCGRRSVGGWRVREARETHSRCHPCHRDEQYDCQRERDDQSLAARWQRLPVPGRSQFLWSWGERPAPRHGTLRRTGACLRRLWCLRWPECPAISPGILNGSSTSRTVARIKENTRKSTQAPRGREEVSLPLRHVTLNDGRWSTTANGK
jgi:hypothetical protein